MFYTLLFHGHLIITLLIHYHCHYIKPLMIMKCAAPILSSDNRINPKQFTQFGYRHSLTEFTAPKANDYSIEYFDYNIIRPNEDIFIKIPYTFTVNILNKKYDTVISAALRDIDAYHSYFYELNHFFLLNFHFLSPKERDFHCSHKVMLRTKQKHTYTYYKLIQHHYTLNTPER